MFGLFGNNEELPKVPKEENRETDKNNEPFFGSATKPSSPLPTNGISTTWRDATSPTRTVTSPPPTSTAFPGFIPFLDSVSGTTNSINEAPSTPKSIPNHSAPDDNPVVLNSAIKMLQKRLDEEKQKNKELKEQMENDTPISLAPFSIDKSLRLRESFGQFFGMTEAESSTNTTEDKPLVVEELQSPPLSMSSPFAIPSIPMSFFGAMTDPSSTLNVDNEGNIPPAPPSFYNNMMPSIPFYGSSKEVVATTGSASASASARQNPAIDVQVPPILSAQAQAQTETVPPSPPISSPFSVHHINPLSYFGTATESTPVSASQGPVIDVQVPPILTTQAQAQSETVPPSPPISSPFSVHHINPLSYFGMATESTPVSAPQGPAIDVQVPPILPAQAQAQSETVPPSPPISSPFSVHTLNPLSYFGTASQPSPVVTCPPDSVRDLGTSFDTEVLHQSPAGKASSGSPAKTPNMEPIRVAVEAILEVQNKEDRARIAELEDLLNVANTRNEESERMLDRVREDLHACELQIAAAGETDADRLHRIAELEARTRNYQSRITELESLASTDREQLVDLQTRLEELVTEKRKRDELTGVNPLIQKQRDVDRKEISRLSKLLDETMTALNDTHKACEVAEAQVRELQARAQRTDSISMADSGSTSRESAAISSTDTDNEAAMIRIRELEQQLELLRSSQTSADLCLIQMDEQRKKSMDEAALLRAQLSESQSKLALMELQHQQLVDATIDKPPNTTTPSALRSMSSSSSISGANTAPHPPVTPTSSAYIQPPIPATPATPGPDDAKRMDRVRIINAGLLRLSLDAEFQEDIKVFFVSILHHHLHSDIVLSFITFCNVKRPFVRSAMDIWGGLPGASVLTPQDHESIKEDPGVYRVYPKVCPIQTSSKMHHVSIFLVSDHSFLH